MTKQDLMKEYLDLGTRIERLGNDIKKSLNTPGFEHIELQRMHVQLQTMNLYSMTLKQRIEFHKEKGPVGCPS